MSARRVFPIRTQIDTHPKAARAGTACLILLNLGLLLVLEVPHIDPTIVCCGGQVAPIFTQGQRPRLAGLIRRRRNLAVGSPLAGILVEYPDLDLTAEARAGSNPSVPGSADVVTSQLVGVRDGLLQRERGVGRVIDVKR